MIIEIKLIESKQASSFILTVNDKEAYQPFFYYDIQYKAIAFGGKYTDNTERLKAIMKNIIENNGTFKP